VIEWRTRGRFRGLLLEQHLPKYKKPVFVEILEHCAGKDEMMPEEFIEQMKVRMGSKILTNLALAAGGLHE
jgi:hypothetical protein